MERLPINSIYLATEGEGVHVGSAQVFVRLQGCAIGCLNCDSKDTWDFSEENLMSTLEIANEIIRLSRGIKRISITGGDPLHPKFENGVVELVENLKSDNYFVSIEAAGTRVVDSIFDLVDWISFDYKTPSTRVGMKESLVEKLITQYSNKAQIKAVVERRDDFDAVIDVYKRLNKNDLPWVLTPAYNLGEQFPLERFMNVIEWNQQEGAPFRVIGQQHKWLFGPDKKKV